MNGLAQLPELEEVVAADVVAGEVRGFAVDEDLPGGGHGGGAVVHAGLQLGAVLVGIGHSGGDVGFPLGLVEVHIELALGPVQELGQVTELEIVVVVDVVLLDFHSLPVHHQILTAEHGPGAQGGYAQSQDQHQRQHDGENALCQGTFHW